MAEHYFKGLNEILGGDDFQEESKNFFKNESNFYNTTYQAEVGTVIYPGKKKLIIQPQTEPVKQMKKTKKGKGIVKVIAGVGAVVLCAAGIIYAFNNSDKIREEIKKNSGAIPPSSFSYGTPDNRDNDYSYDDEQNKGFTR